MAARSDPDEATELPVQVLRRMCGDWGRRAATDPQASARLAGHVAIPLVELFEWVELQDCAPHEQARAMQWLLCVAAHHMPATHVLPTARLYRNQYAEFLATIVEVATEYTGQEVASVFLHIDNIAGPLVLGTDAHVVVVGQGVLRVHGPTTGEAFVQRVCDTAAGPMITTGNVSTTWDGATWTGTNPLKEPT